MKVCGYFLWAGSKDDDVLPCIAWEKISCPKDWGGWGIKELSRFSQSLPTKLGWRLSTKDDLWTSVIKRKYIDPLDLDSWL